MAARLVVVPARALALLACRHRVELGAHLGHALCRLLGRLVLHRVLGVARHGGNGLATAAEGHHLVEVVVLLGVLDHGLGVLGRDAQQLGHLGLINEDGVLVDDGVERGVLGGKALRLVRHGVLELVGGHAHGRDGLLGGEAGVVRLHGNALVEGVERALHGLGRNALLKALGELLGAQAGLGRLDVLVVDGLELLAHRLPELVKVGDARDVLGNPGVAGDVSAVPAVLGDERAHGDAHLVVGEVRNRERDLDGVVRAQRVDVVAVDEERLGLVGHVSSCGRGFVRLNRSW